MGARDIVGGKAQAHLFVGRETSSGTRFGIQFWDSDLSAPIKQGILGDVLASERSKPVPSRFGTADFLPNQFPYRVSLIQRQLRRDCRDFIIGFSPRCTGDGFLFAVVSRKIVSAVAVEESDEKIEIVRSVSLSSRRSVGRDLPIRESRKCLKFTDKECRTYDRCPDASKSNRFHGCHALIPVRTSATSQIRGDQLVLG